MPNRAATHIQKTAPAPPRVMAVATPTMFPVPIAPAKAVVIAWKAVMLPFSFSCFFCLWKKLPIVWRNHRENRVIWNPFSRTV